MLNQHGSKVPQDDAFHELIRVVSTQAMVEMGYLNRTAVLLYIPALRSIFLYGHILYT